ncbi:hypothetical protein MTZ49_01655 [Entomomonas sp. E2T0]|uniref:hypothetical protein n=1 Tax=Entomomonas sp. E2T0 TaxID=2930213 RepID=UPI0022282D2E|nr:hypothetical protein [Entomomonas sp. E2T0]UYZ84313.1 hypothetical protein MTZ49_01655 [Entomomonas sp. E2T0]
MTDKKIQLYRPSNSYEGDWFHCEWCRKCARDSAMNEGLSIDECDDSQKCEILGDTFIYEVDDPDYPKQWQYNEQGHPICTAFIAEGEPIPPIREDKTIDMFEGEQ